MQRAPRNLLHKLSIRNLLLVTILLPVLAVTAVGSLTALGRNTAKLRQHAIEEVRALIAAHRMDFIRSIVFNAPDMAADTTARFVAYGHVLDLQVYNQAGKLALSYVRPDETLLPIVPAPGLAAQAEIRDHAIHVIEPVELQGARYGTVFLRTSTTDLDQHLQDLYRRFVALVSGLLITALILAYALQRVFSRPIERLVGAIRQVASTADYSTRVPVAEANEFGVLANGFNAMLDQIQVANQTLNEDKLRMQITLASIGDGVLTIDEQGLVTYLNPAAEAILGQTSAQLAGRPIADVFPVATAESAEAIIHPALQCLHAGQALAAKTYTFSLVPDKKPVIVECSVAPLSGGAAAGRGAVVVLRDVSSQREADALARRALEEKLSAEAANQAKSAFLAHMSHELRTPLNAIIGYAEIVTETAQEQGMSEAVSDLQKIHHSGHHLLALINDILDLSKIEAGKMELYVETVDVEQLTKELGETVRPLTEKNANKLVVRCAQNVGVMQSDLTKLRQCLLNLLSNACKFTRQGMITLDIQVVRRADTEWLEFAVQDSGIGMSHEQLQKIFEPFSQANAGTTRKYGGTGLGLAISLRFCTMLGGELTVQSTQGQGSRFLISLPRHVNVDDISAQGIPVTLDPRCPRVLPALVD